MGSTAVVLAFEVDQLPASGAKSRLVAIHSPDGGAYVFLSVLDDGRVVYHNSGSGDITSSSTIGTGFHTLTLRRTSSTVTVKVDGATFLDGSYSMASWLPKSNNAFVLGATGTNKELDGGIYEARYWDGTIPSQTTLDAIADPQDSSFDTAAQGDEDGLWFLQPVLGGGGGNSAPTADLTQSGEDGVIVEMDASGSSDPDGDSLTYDWDWGDGSTTTNGNAIEIHEYACDASSNTYTVTVTVSDGNGGSDSAQQGVTVSADDEDSDGLLDCEERSRSGLDPNDADSDNDEFEDGAEDNNFGQPGIFCGSTCEYPDPATRDIYLEVDGWKYCDSAGSCTIRSMSDSVRDAIEADYADTSPPINLHIDNGQLGGGDTIINGLRENFDAGPPITDWTDNWTLTGLWHVSSACENPPSSPYYIAFNQDSDCEYSTGSPELGVARFQVDLRGTRTATLKFDHKWETESSVETFDVMQVQVSTNDGVSWDTIARWDAGDPNQASWTSESISLDGYRGNIVDIRFRFQAGDSIENSYAGWFVDNVNVDFEKQSIAYASLEGQYEGNPNYFDLDREGIFHQMVLPPYLDSGNCGTADIFGEYSAVAEAAHRSGGGCSSSTDPAFLDTIHQELAHNDLANIEPASQECDQAGAPYHDKFGDYSMATGYCGSVNFADLKDPYRWDEFKQQIADPDPNEGNSGDSPGDLNNGLRG